MSGTGIPGDYTSVFADSAFLYGSCFLFCKKFPKASRLVCRDEAVQKTSEQLCTGTGNDYEHKAPDCGNGFRDYGNRISFNGGCTCRKDLSGSCLGVSSFLFFLQDTHDSCKHRSVVGQKNNRRKFAE